MLFDDTCDYPVRGGGPSGWATSGVPAEHWHNVMPPKKFTQLRCHPQSMADMKARVASRNRGRCTRSAEAGATVC